MWLNRIVEIVKVIEKWLVRVMERILETEEIFVKYLEIKGREFSPLQRRGYSLGGRILCCALPFLLRYDKSCSLQLTEHLAVERWVELAGAFAQAVARKEG